MKRVQSGSPVSRGMTLLELLVAVAMSGLVLISLFYAWRHISLHTIRGRQSSEFHFQVDALARSIIFQIRNSPRILTWSTGRICFLSAEHDTICYEKVDSLLYRNDLPVRPASNDVWFDEFVLEEKGNVLIETAETLLSMRMSLRDGKGNTTSLKLDALVHLPDQQEKYDDFFR